MRERESVRVCVCESERERERERERVCMADMEFTLLWVNYILHLILKTFI